MAKDVVVNIVEQSVDPIIPVGSLYMNADGTWLEIESGDLSDVFTTKKGRYTKSGSSTLLLKTDDHGDQVGELKNYDQGTVQPDSHGDGTSDETHTTFKWKIQQF